MKPQWLVVLMFVASQGVLLSEAAPQQKKDKGKQPALPKVALTPGPSVLKAPVKVALKYVDPEAMIRYTIDGSTPAGPEDGLAYTGPINIDKTTTLTAVAFKKGEPSSPPSAGTYLVDPKEGLHTFHIGNSLTGTTAKFADFVKTAGIVHQYQSFTAGGAWTKGLWDKELANRKEAFDKMLAGYKQIDHFTCQPRDFNIPEEADYDIKFFDVIRKHSPNVQPWFYTEWVEKGRKRPTDQGKVPTSQMKTTYPALTWEESMAAMLLYTEELQLKVCETYKQGKRPRVLPSSLAMGWIKNMIDNGKFPGAAPGAFYPLLFNDDVHPNIKGGYLVDLTWYAAFYREPPDKLLPAGTGLTLEQANVMKKLAWDVIKNYPDCGLYEEGTMPTGTPTFSARPAGKDATLVTFASTTNGAWFRYTLDGTTPTRTRGYVYCGIISMRPGMTLKAVAYKSGMADSPVAEVAYEALTSGK